MVEESLLYLNSSAVSAGLSKTLLQCTTCHFKNLSAKTEAWEELIGAHGGLAQLEMGIVLKNDQKKSLVLNFSKLKKNCFWKNRYKTNC